MWIAVGHNEGMLDAQALQIEDLQGLSREAVTELAATLLAQLSAQQAALAAKDEHIAQRDREIRFKDARIERITFELARLKAWKFSARTEAMNAQQRQMFEDTAAEDEADLQAQLQALKAHQADSPKAARQLRPRRQHLPEHLPEHLRRVIHHHEPESTVCPTPQCGQTMVRIGEDVSERLDIVPAEFFVHRHIRGKWVCKCCQLLRQGPAAPQIIDKGQPSAGLIAHTLVSRFVDHLPYYRLAQINARSGVHTPRSTLASWSGAGGASLAPLYEAQRAFVLSADVLHADENTGEDARSWCGQDDQSLRVGLCPAGARCDGGCGLRLLRRPRFKVPGACLMGVRLRRHWTTA